jgi:hypothetical protein
MTAAVIFLAGCCFFAAKRPVLGTLCMIVAVGAAL